MLPDIEIVGLVSPTYLAAPGVGSDQDGLSAAVTERPMGGCNQRREPKGKLVRACRRSKIN
jgi:hypothetical protein